jgi:hypothetical protein
MAIEQVRWELFGQNKTALVFAVYLLNSGAPSITRGWHGSIRIGNGNEEKLESFVATGPWILQQDGQSVTIHPEDSIVAKTLERRLETGEGKVGRVFFALPGNRISQLVTANFDVTLGFYDYKGKLVQGKFVPHSAPLIGVQIFPGEKGSV